MQEFQFYIDLIKRLIDMNELKETVFYNEGEWYSREHSRIISLEELEKMVLEVAKENYRSNEVWQTLEAFVHENCEEGLMDKFWTENEEL